MNVCQFFAIVSSPPSSLFVTATIYNIATS
jgi:hypothetical protein